MAKKKSAMFSPCDVDIPLPAWVIVDTENQAKVGLPASAAILKDFTKTVDDYLPVFSSEELAVAFIADSKRALDGFTPFKIAELTILLDLLQSLRAVGGEHVGIDIRFEKKEIAGEWKHLKNVRHATNPLNAPSAFLGTILCDRLEVKQWPDLRTRLFAETMEIAWWRMEELDKRSVLVTRVLWISLAEAERLTGINRGTISKAISEGSINSNGATGKGQIKINAVSFIHWLSERAKKAERQESTPHVEKLMEATRKAMKKAQRGKRNKT